MFKKRLSFIMLGLVAAGYLVLGALYAFRIPPWQSPDEPAHYNYVAQIVNDGCCPVIEPGDWDSAYLDEVKGAGFPPEADLSPIQYEDHQPPLYYLLASLIYNLTSGDLIALRLLSVAFGVGVVLAAYFVVARLFPQRLPLAVAAAAFVAFVPQHLAMMSSANNDSLGEMLLGIVLVVAVTYLGNPASALGKDEESAPTSLPEAQRPHAVALGGLVGIIFLTKFTVALPAVLAVAAAIIARWRIERRSWRWLLGQIAWSAGLAVALGSLWWVRNIIVYGWPDFLAQNAHNAVVVGQMRTEELITRWGFWAYVWEFLSTTYESFWGQFGWMALPMPTPIYNRIGRFLLAVLVGLVVLGTVFRFRGRLAASQKAGIGVLAAVAFGALGTFLYWNLTFVQFQGRYLFPMLIPAGLLITAGLWGLALLIGRLIKAAWWQEIIAWLPLVVIVAWLPWLAAHALFVLAAPNL